MNSWVVRIFVVAVAAALLILGLALVPHFTGTKSKAAPLPELATASVRSFPVTVGARGTVVPASQVDIGFDTSGRLVEIDAKVGAKVKKGAVLARLNDDAAKSDVTTASAGVAFARAQLVTALGRGIPGEIAAAHALIDQATSELQAKQAALAARTLAAPISGTVFQVNGQVGENVSPSATTGATLPGTAAPVPAVSGITPTAGQNPPLVVLGDPTNFVIGAAFTSTDAQKLVAGQKGTITADTVSGLSIPCHVLALANGATTINGAPMVWVSVVADGPPDKLSSGMAVDVTIGISQADNVLAVVRSAVYQLGGVPHVDVWDGKRPVSTVVGTGQQGTELVQITSGLTAGQQVVLSAFHGLPPTATTVVGSP